MMNQPSLGQFSRYVNHVGVASVFLFAFCAWLNTTGAGIAIDGLLLAFVLSPKARSMCLRDPVFWIFILFAGYIFWSDYRAVTEFPGTATLQHKDAINWLKIFIFLPFAWWLGGDVKRIQWVFTLALLGLVAGNLIHFDWGDFTSFNISTRSGFKFAPAFTGLISTTALLGLLLFSQRIWSLPYPWVIRPFWLAGLYISLFMLLASQARAAWLAAGGIIPLIIAAYCFHSLKKFPRKSFTVILPMGLAVALLLTIMAGSLGPIQSRLKTERTTANALLHGQKPPTGQPANSLSKRYQVQMFGLHKWLERPLLGWGPGSGKDLIVKSNDPELKVKTMQNKEVWLPHCHNTYLESLVRLGVVGSILLLGVTGLIVYTLITAVRQKIIPYDYLLFLIGSSVLLALWNLFDFRVVHADWRAYWIILAGTIYSCRYSFHKS
jgi:O-antigen ligase